MSSETSLFDANIIGSRLFVEHDQRIFANATGDYNPIHMDPLVARRTQVGATIVHGIHTLLWLLNQVAEKFPDLPPIATVKTQFKKAIYVDDKIEAVVIQKDSSLLRVEAITDKETAIAVLITFGAASLLPSFIPLQIGEIQYAPSSAFEFSWEEIAGQFGRLAFAGDKKELNRLFPDLVRLWGVDRVIALGCTSTLVGMVMPGLHSIYSALDFHLSEQPAPDKCLSFRVKSLDSRFRLIRQDFSGGGIWGSLECFFRRGVIQQASMIAVRSRVPHGTFVGTTSFIVGGSRGLGELTAKIIAAGGGRIVLTYASGRIEAEQVCSEIIAGGGKCSILPYNVFGDAAPQLATISKIPSHIYYFATPPIFGRKNRTFNQAQFDIFNAFYVDGFDRLIKAVLHRCPKGIRAFYPSSIAVTNRPPGMTAYAMSKAAGEVLCADINAYWGKVQVIVSRLPRLLTDQTATLLEAETEDPITIMLPLIQKMQGNIPRVN